MPINVILNVQPLGFPWQTRDSFLFCVYHDDANPRGNGAMAAQQRLATIELLASSVEESRNGAKTTDIAAARPAHARHRLANGPFVMNTLAEIRQAFADYQRTQFSG